ncbi:TPA: hypothetical protein ACIQMB_004272 [Bacillus pacificus]|nr:hypothetical protein A6E25_21375 [Bacillus cereus]
MTAEQNENVAEQVKRYPNDKAELLQGGNGCFDMYNVQVMQKVFPRIIREVHDLYKSKGKKVPQIRDVVAFYFTLHAYIYKQSPLDSFYGASFQSYEKIMSHLNIDRSRIKWLADILEANGLIRRERRREGLKNRVLYFPSYAPRISDDGYLVDKNGEKIKPNMEVYEIKKRGEKPVTTPVCTNTINDSAV